MSDPTPIALQNISLQEFNMLSGQEREQIIFSKGNFLDSKLEQERVYALYAVNQFFVEIEYDLMDFYISNIRAVKSGDMLAKYT